MTATEKAKTAALQVVVWSRQNSNKPITRDMIDGILSRDRDMWWGDAYVRTVRMWVRRIAILSTDVVALTDREERRLHKARFDQMNRDELAALNSEIYENQDDPRGWDKNFVHALSVALKFYSPKRIPGPRVRIPR